MPLVYKTILAVLFICSSFPVAAIKLNDISFLQNIDHELNQKPWQTYQKLQSQADELSGATVNYKLWWLLRKAQAENLLNLSDEFQRTVSRAKKLLNEKTPKRIDINFSIFQGVILQRQGKYQQAQALLEKAQQTAMAEKYTHLAVNAKLELAFTRSLTELYEYSLTGLQQAYVEAFALNNDYLMAKINEVYGDIYGYLHDYEKSIEYYQKALTSYQRLGYPAREAEALYGIAVTYRYWAKYDLALDYYRQYQKAIEYSPNNVEGEFYALYGISMSFSGKGDCTQALSYIDKSLRLSGLNDYKAELYKRQALCFIEEGKLDLAENSLNNAATIFVNIPELMGTRWQIEVIKIRAKLFQSRGENEQAYFLLKQFNERKVAQMKKSASDRLIRVKGALEGERHNVEYSLKQQRDQVQKLKLAQKTKESNLHTYLMLCAFLLIISILVCMHFKWEHKQKTLALFNRDSLTNHYSRHYILEFLNKLVSTTNLAKNKISVMLIDIDDLKQINEQYDYTFGDQVIREIATISKDTIRLEDVIGRVAGDQFLCVLPRIDSIQCLHIAQRLVKNVHTSKIFVDERGEQQVKITVSIGISTTLDDVINHSELYLEAEKALFYAKSSGKNRAVQYQPAL